MRFVMLAHYVGTLDRPDHFDVLFEQPGRDLLTWQIRRPFFAPGWQSAKRLSDHRRAYLTYQGPIVGRGWVQRIAAGRFVTLANDERVFRAILHANEYSAIAEFQRDAPWAFRLRVAKLGA